MANESVGLPARALGMDEPACVRVDSNVDLAMAFHPLPQGHAYVEITEAGDSAMRVGDVVCVDLRVTGCICDAPYALEIDGAQMIRRVQGRASGLFVYWGEQGKPFDPARMRILGMVKSCQGMRSFSEW